MHVISDDQKTRKVLKILYFKVLKILYFFKLNFQENGPLDAKPRKDKLRLMEARNIEIIVDRNSAFFLPGIYHRIDQRGPLT